MRELFVLAEHREGGIREITFEMLTKGRELAEKTNTELTAVLLGHSVNNLAEKLTNYARKVLIIDHDRLENFNSDAYQSVLSHLITQRKPSLILIGSTSLGMDLAPNLAAELKIPLATDCIDLYFEGAKLMVIRQMYGGKVDVKASLRKSHTYMVTVRPATFKVQETAHLAGKIIEISVPLPDMPRKKFIKYVHSLSGRVDLTTADILVSVGRGIKDAADILMVKELADVLGGVLACSRPIVDKKWLPKEHQVGQSGKTVKPKLYFACGISGASQHLAGMRSSDTIVAINIDPSAPIFKYADYGIIGDLYEVVPKLIEEMRRR